MIRKNPNFEVSSTGDSLLLVAKIVQTLEQNLVELTPYAEIRLGKRKDQDDDDGGSTKRQNRV